VVAGQEHGAKPVGHPRGEALRQAAHQPAERAGAGLIEYIAGDEQQVDLLLIEHLDYLVDAGECVVGAVEAADAGAEMPVAGVQDLHRAGSPQLVGVAGPHAAGS